MHHFNTILSIPPEGMIKAKVCRILFGGSSTVRCPYCCRTGCTRYGEKFHCRRCKANWSLTSLTWMKGMKLSWQVFWGLLWAYTSKVPIDQTGRLLKVSRPTIYRWFELFRKNLPDLEDVRLEGNVQIDEAYFGGRKKGVAVIGAKQKGTSKVAAIIIPASSVNRTDILPFLRQHVVPGSKLLSDGALIYKGIGKHWPLEHEYDLHKKFQFSRTSEIEGFWGALRTHIRRMYHHVTVKKLPEMVREYQYRLMHPEIFETPLTFLQKTLPTVSFA